MNVVVFTTIQPPTDPLKHWAWPLVGVGDRKTPNGWHLDGCTFIDQARQTGRLADLLPWNHYCRKMIGYLAAARMGATAIIDTDDDNDPKPNFAVPPFDGEYDCIEHPGFANVYTRFTDQPIWPRGFPLNLIAEATFPPTTTRRVTVGVWQGLADDDPDVDAIYRMTRPGRVFFNSNPPVVLGRGAICPFNSQNTIIRKELFPLLYLPAVSFRFTDILRGLVAQPIMWAAGYHLGFTQATVAQARNQHDLMADFRLEIPVYLHAAEIPAIVSAAISSTASVCDNLLASYTAMKAHGIVDDAEIPRLEAWLEELVA